MLLAALLITALCAGALAAEAPARVLRVPFPEVKGFSETSEDGTRRGLVVDYLNEIAKYTGWEYEYIDTDGGGMIEEFLDGKYDLMGALTTPQVLKSISHTRITTSGTADRCLWPVWMTTASTVTTCGA